MLNFALAFGKNASPGRRRPRETLTKVKHFAGTRKRRNFAGLSLRGRPEKQENIETFAIDETVQEKLGRPQRASNMSLLSISDNPRRQRDRHPGTGDDLRPARRARETPSKGRSAARRTGTKTTIQKGNLQHKITNNGEFDPGSG